MTQAKQKQPTKSTPHSANGSADHKKSARVFHKTIGGTIYHGDSLAMLNGKVAAGSTDLIMTSPPFGLVRKKAYGNVDAREYLDWFRPFGEAFKRVLKPQGSLVIDIGGAWISGQPTRSLYHFELLIMLCKEFGFHLAQELFWWNPSKLPSPAEWVTVRRVRVKDAVNCIWWLSPTPWPKASNLRVTVPYSDAMKSLLKNGYTSDVVRPSGHDISSKFSQGHGSAIPPNLIAVPNTESNSFYLRYCKKHGIKPHPARFPAALPEYFIRMLTDEGDSVIDPFAGSCVTGEVAGRLGRQWTCCDLVEDYLQGALGRFITDDGKKQLNLSPSGASNTADVNYRISHPGSLWSEKTEGILQDDGGKTRPSHIGRNGHSKRRE